MDLLIVGIGYVGLVAGTCFAEQGHDVTCLDIDHSKIENLKQGIIPIYEPNLDEMVKRNIQANRLTFTTDYLSSVDQAKVCIIAVDTPITREGTANLKSIYQVALSIAQQMKDYKLIVIKSTVPVGTSQEVSRLIHHVLKEREVNIEFDIVSNPEFLKEGDAIHDFMNPDRVIIGVETPQAADLMKQVYSPFNFHSHQLLIMDIASAELSKYAANAMLATRISFMNELSGFCEIVGADIEMIRQAIGSDHRIGNKFLYAGTGYGGSCFPKDIKALQTQATQLNYIMPMIRAVEIVNRRQKQIIGEKIQRYFADKGGIKNKVIAILGLSFKPNTDDMREAPSLTLIYHLLEEGALLRLFDPIAMHKAKSLFSADETAIHWSESPLEAVKQVDAVVLMTEWQQFRFLPLDDVLSLMNGRAFFDGRNQYDPQEMAKKGFDYFSIGRLPAHAEKSELPNLKTLELELSL
jgi:UDPglucose 6-dehydrogenase